MINNLRLSIIIPAYNSGKYIKKCLYSCLNQDISHDDYEIIVVDDGSTDNTKAIVLSIKEKYNNIIYIYQENAAQGAARNNGLSKAQGKYIWFVDSDDWIAENCLSNIIQNLESGELTAVLVGHATQHPHYLDKWEKLDENKVVSGKDLLAAHKLFISPTYGIWKKHHLTNYNLTFKEKLFHEDTEFYPRLFYNAQRIGFISQIYYFVYANPNSTTRGINPKRSFDMIKVISYLNDFKEKISENRIKSFLTDYICININAALYNTFSFDKTSQDNFSQYLYQNRTLLKSLRYSSRLKYRMEGILFSLFPKNIIFIYKCLQFFNENPGGIKKEL